MDPANKWKLNWINAHLKCGLQSMQILGGHEWCVLYQIVSGHRISTFRFKSLCCGVVNHDNKGCSLNQWEKNLQMEPLNLRRRGLCRGNFFLHCIVLEFWESEKIESYDGSLQAFDCIFIYYTVDFFRICTHLLYITAVYAFFLALRTLPL